MTARKRLAVEGAWALEGSAWRLCDAEGSLVTWIPREAVVSVEDIPDALPTEPGTVLDALVTIDGASERRVVVRSDDAPSTADGLIWFSARKIAGIAWVADENLSDWQVIPTGIPEPAEFGVHVRDSGDDLWVRSPGASNWKCVTDPIAECDWPSLAKQFGPLELVTP